MATIFDKNKPPQDELEIDRLAEVELSRLQRQFRIMEGDRVAFAEESGTKLGKQKALIQILSNERQNIVTELKVSESARNKHNDMVVTRKLNELLQEQDKYVQDTKTEKAHLEEIDYQIKKVTNEIKVYERGAVTDRICQERVLRAQRMLQSLENKLEVAIKKFNVVLAENDRLRQEIDHLIKERAHFNHLWQMMIGNLNRGKKFMMDLVEQASIAYDQREEWCGKLAALKERGRADLMHHTQEMRDLQRNLDHDGKLQEFLGIKGQRRIMADLMAREAERRRVARKRMEDQLDRYRDIFTQIKEFSGEENIERLASQFLKQEEENFALFNYVNELNYELETLNDSVDELRIKIDEQHELNDIRVQQQESRIAEMEAQLEKSTKRANDAENVCTNWEKKLADTLAGINSIFQMAKCDNSPILELLGDNSVVSQFNAQLYLGILEKRTNDLINNVYYKDKYGPKEKAPSASKKDKGGRDKTMTVKNNIKEPSQIKPRTMPLNKIVKTQPCPLCVELEQVSDVVETLQKPQLRDEVQEKLDVRLTLPDALDRLHNVSACHLPKARLILQKRYL